MFWPYLFNRCDLQEVNAAEGKEREKTRRQDLCHFLNRTLVTYFYFFFYNTYYYIVDFFFLSLPNDCIILYQQLDATLKYLYTGIPYLFSSCGQTPNMLYYCCYNNNIIQRW